MLVSCPHENVATLENLSPCHSRCPPVLNNCVGEFLLTFFFKPPSTFCQIADLKLEHKSDDLKKNLKTHLWPRNMWHRINNDTFAALIVRLWVDVEGGGILPSRALSMLLTKGKVLLFQLIKHPFSSGRSEGTSQPFSWTVCWAEQKIVTKSKGNYKLKVKWNVLRNQCSCFVSY